VWRTQAASARLEPLLPCRKGVEGVVFTQTLLSISPNESYLHCMAIWSSLAFYPPPPLSPRSRGAACIRLPPFPLTAFHRWQVFVPNHPLVAHWLAVCRNKASPPPIFRNAVAELGRILIYEAAAEWLPTVSGQVETPLGVADCSFVDPNKPVKVRISSSPQQSSREQRGVDTPHPFPSISYLESISYLLSIISGGGGGSPCLG
jgi:hypothetical protein